jgi:hypothetical protein
VPGCEPVAAAPVSPTTSLENSCGHWSCVAFADLSARSLDTSRPVFRVGRAAASNHRVMMKLDETDPLLDLHRLQ